MRYVIFSDIHAYPKALKNVLEDIAGKQVDRTICLGDIVGFGPDPAGAVEMCRILDVCVSGNNDEELVSLCGSGTVAADSANVVSREQILWLSQLPKIYAQDTFICTHKKFEQRDGIVVPGFGYLFRPEDADESLDATSGNYRIAFVGHTHEPCVWDRDETVGVGSIFSEAKSFTLKEGHRYVVNVGTVGYPRHSGCSSYVIYDDQAGTLDFCHLQFDFAEYLRSFECAIMDAPQWVKERVL